MTSCSKSPTEPTAASVDAPPLGLLPKSCCYLVSAYLSEDEVWAARSCCRLTSETLSGLVADRAPEGADAELVGFLECPGPTACYEPVPLPDRPNPLGRPYWRATAAFAAARLSATTPTEPEGIRCPNDTPTTAARLEAFLRRGPAGESLRRVAAACDHDAGLLAVAVRACPGLFEKLDASDRLGPAKFFAAAHDWRTVDLVPVEGRTLALGVATLAAAERRAARGGPRPPDATAGRVVAHVPVDAPLARRAVDATPAALDVVPHHLVDRALVVRAVKRDVDAFRFAPDHLVDHDLARSVVERRPDMIATVPRRLRTVELFATLLPRDPALLRFAPAHVRANAALVLDAVKAVPPHASDDAYPNLAFVRLAALAHSAVRADPTFFDTLLDRDPRNLGLLPLKRGPAKLRLAEDVCVKAVRRNPKTLIFVPANIYQAVLRATGGLCAAR